jgi:hypothetical protein
VNIEGVGNHKTSRDVIACDEQPRPSLNLNLLQGAGGLYGMKIAVIYST